MEETVVVVKAALGIGIVALCGCSGLQTYEAKEQSRFQRVTSGYIGCAEDEITVRNVMGGFSPTQAWEATCRERTYYCSRQSVGQAFQISCTEAVSAATIAQASGCQHDTQCKGDRVCVESRCADPKPGEPSPGAAIGAADPKPVEAAPTPEASAAP
jgi:hypothetical protein